MRSGPTYLLVAVVALGCTSASAPACPPWLPHGQPPNCAADPSPVAFMTDPLAGCETRVSSACLAHLFHACPERAALRCQQWRAAAAARQR